MISSNDALRLSFEVAISLLLVFVIVAWCLQLLMPFIGLITWGAIIGISLHTPFCSLRNRIGGKLASVIFALIGLAGILVPAWLFAESIIGPTQAFAAAVETRSFDIPAPAEQVKSWPLVGEQVYMLWAEASDDMGTFLSAHAEQFRSVASFALAKAAGAGIAVLLLVASVLIAVGLLANDQAVIRGLNLLFIRLAGVERGPELMQLTTATVRSVTMGVLGVAFIQSVLAGLGMVAVGVPAAGIWAAVVLVLAIAQLPPLLVLLPVAIYVFSVESTTVATVFAIYSFVVAFGDTFLKPLLLGRGVDVPTLVILLGAIGGMLTSGLVGLFVGAVVLALGYKLMVAWIALGQPEDAVQAPAQASAPDPAGEAPGA